MAEEGMWLRKKQTNQTKPVTKSSKSSKTPWIILFSRVELNFSFLGCV